ncbi:MAG: hypothetical protein QM256_05485 [Pseudomonadota bacterium]|jgi:hypothetical protein|nr:hypothetical protein [Syntrophaceae bacterium]MDI9555225.1 hypothetical protein [Pseudomonadota bacterium]NLX32523.1 hypothetical protein [Deltaproteobacteria bacterium]HNU85462.1 hypothetical protein [Syntrophales bacterium]HNZ35089.1 hypothetical protein [Syntrophales bacterium]
MESPNLVTALAYYTVSAFLDPIQWLICGICGWSAERLDQAVIAAAGLVAVLFVVLTWFYPDGKLFSFPTPHAGFAILGKAIGAMLMTGLIHWLKKRQLSRKTGT